MALIKVSSFEARLKELVGENNQTEIALNIGMSKQSISAYLSGTRKAKPPTIKALAEYFNVNTCWLSGYDIDKNASQPTPATYTVIAEEYALIEKIRHLKDSGHENIIDELNNYVDYLCNKNFLQGDMLELARSLVEYNDNQDLQNDKAEKQSL